MTILTLTDKGTLKLPREALDHLKDAQHLQLRLNSHGITLMPVRIESANSRKDFPPDKAANS